MKVNGIMRYCFGLSVAVASTALALAIPVLAMPDQTSLDPALSDPVLSDRALSDRDLPNPVLPDRTLGRPTILIPATITTSARELKLGAIATIRSGDAEYEPLLRALQEISLGEAPGPNQTLTLLGEEILEKIKDSGVELESIGYSIPAQVIIKREGREVKEEEVLSALQKVLKAKNVMDLQVKQIKWDSALLVPTGPSEVQVDFAGVPLSGKLPLRVELFVNGQPEARFVATALVDDWREIPVLRRGVERGMLIQPGDVQMVRLNVNSHPGDIVHDVNGIIGRRAKNSIPAGETIRRNAVDIPPVIEKGKRVSMVYEVSGLRATAIGIAQEDGQLGDKIRLQNESSKRVVEGRIINPQEVRVLAQ